MRFFLSASLSAILSVSVVWAQVSTEGLDLDGDVGVWFQNVSQNEPPFFLQGVQYNINEQNKDQNQFFKSLSWIEGDLVFSGRQFSNVKLLYNTYEDVLIALNIGMIVHGAPAILLNQHEIAEFTIYGIRFLHIEGNNVPPPGVGYYELYYLGKTLQTLVKHSKIKDTGASGVIYKEKSEIFLNVDNRYYKLTGKRSLIKVLPEKKDQIKRFIKANGVKFNKQRQEGLKDLFIFCDEILKD